MQKTITELLAETMQFLIARSRTVTVSALVFAMMIAVVSGFLARRMELKIAETLTQSGLTREQFNEVLMQELQRQSSSSPLSMQQVSQILDESDPTEKADPQETVIRFFVAVLPAVLTALVVGMLILVLSSSFALVHALAVDVAPMALIQRTLVALPGLVLLGLWMLVRSLVWLPFIGPLVALFTVPRLLIAPTFFVIDRRGIFPATGMSIRYTRGSTLRILGSLIVLALITIVLLWASIILSGFLSIELPRLGFVLWMFLLQWILAFAVTFTTRLSMTIIEHPASLMKHRKIKK